jgi:hypothetical protein
LFWPLWLLPLPCFHEAHRHTCLHVLCKNRLA